MLKINNKNARTTSLTPFSSVSIVDLEQVNVSLALSELTLPCLALAKGHMYLNKPTAFSSFVTTRH